MHASLAVALVKIIAIWAVQLYNNYVNYLPLNKYGSAWHNNIMLLDLKSQAHSSYIDECIIVKSLSLDGNVKDILRLLYKIYYIITN